MDWNIAVLGSVGSGKTTAIRTISDIEVVDTDVDASDEETLALKATTTVAMDMGVMDLGNGDRLRLHGAPGQDRFDFMWEILLEQAKGALIFIDHSRPDPVEDMRTYIQAFRENKNSVDYPLVIGVTHAENDPDRDLAKYTSFFQSQTNCTCNSCKPPVFWCDARSSHDVGTLLIVMTALLETTHRNPVPVLHDRFQHHERAGQ